VQQRADSVGCAGLFRHGPRWVVLPGGGGLNAPGPPAFGLLLQGIWSSLRVLPRTFDETRQTYGNLYRDLLDSVVSAALMFDMLTIAGSFRLRRRRPHVPRPVVAWGLPWLPARYLLGAGAILAILTAYRPASTWPGLVLVASGLPVFVLETAGVGFPASGVTLRRRLLGHAGGALRSSQHRMHNRRRISVPIEVGRRGRYWSSHQ